MFCFALLPQVNFPPNNLNEKVMGLNPGYLLKSLPMFFYFQVFDDVCSELAMAILQFWQGKPPEEEVFRTLKAMNKFCTIAHRDVPALVKMIGPEPSKFNGMSARVDELIEILSAKLARVAMF